MTISSRIDLDHGWSFRQKDDLFEKSWMPVKSVPSDVYTDLLANQKILDPFQDLNELAVRWVANKDWIYRTEFKAPERVTGDDDLRTDIVFEGLDTFAEVHLNGVHILQSENMFLTHRVDITEHLKPENELEIVFSSARIRGQELVKQHSHEHRFIARQTEESRIPVRKAQYHWGWDWGPILSGTSGLWRPVYLEQYIARVDDVWVQYRLSEKLQRCSGCLFAKLDTQSSKTDQVRFALTLDDSVVLESETELDVNGLARYEFEIADPKLWFPREYGNQSRYKLSATLVRDKKELDEKSKLIGFRSVELVQEPDAFGKSFYFRINGVDVFAGGSCWIPGSSYLSQISKMQYRAWIELLAEGNQTMVRVWGGGIYEDDSFFEACDDLGILVFQDFCFACGSYPTYPSFLATVEIEARQNVRRLRNHPSLVIWAGSNEDYQVQERYKLDYDYEDKDPESWLKSSFPARYLYEYLLPKIVQEEDTGVVYHPTSPWGDGKPTSDPTVGDLHQWNIWHGDMAKYQHASHLSGRFISEFGMEAYPHLETIGAMATISEQQYPGSMVMDFHNKAIGHERRLLSYITENFQCKHDLGSFTHLSQMVQAEAMHFAYKTWRREWGLPGARKCGGVLVWQLNDCWPTMSWAVVDYFLVKKPAYYSIARALAPVAIGVSRTIHDWTKTVQNPTLDLGHVDPTLDARQETKFEVWVVSSRRKTIEGELKVRFVSIRSGKDVVPPIVKAVTLAPNSTTEVLSQAIAPLGSQVVDADIPFDLRRYDPYIIYASVSLSGEVVAVDTAWPQPFKYLDFSDRRVSARADERKGQVVISAGRPVKGFVFEETKTLKLSTNNLDIVPGEDHVVQVAGVALDELRFTYVGAPAASMKIHDIQLD